MKRHWWKVAAGFLVLGAAALPGRAADHIDGPAVVANPDVDLADVYAWMTPDGTKVNLALTWFPFATDADPLDTQTVFDFHVVSMASFGAAEKTEVVIPCVFDGSGADTKVSCWIGDEDYVTGPANDRAGTTSASGRVKVFAGQVNDPFFFNLDGFLKTAEIVTGAAGGLSFDPAGCPMLDSATSNALVTQLKSDADGSAATDDLAGTSVQVIVLQLDKALLTQSGPILGVHAGTHVRQ